MHKTAVHVQICSCSNQNNNKSLIEGFYLTAAQINGRINRKLCHENEEMYNGYKHLPFQFPFF